MHKVLIVDDEIFVRKGLINLIDWPSLQFEICGEAENGAQALTLIQQRSPDLVIVDIRMPVLDGLELIRQVIAQGGHQPLFIILSGYPDFSYAQQAFRYNVSDYILKPVNEQEIAATLKRIATTLNQKQLLSMTREKPLVEIIIESLVQAEPEEQVMTQIAHTLELPLTSSYSYVIAEIQDKLPHREIDYMQPLQSLLQRFFHLEGQPLLIHVRAYNQYGFIVPPLWQDEHYGSERMGYMKLHQCLEDHLSTEIALFAGHKVDQLKKIVHSRTSADECLKYRFAVGFNGVFMAAELLDQPLYYYDVDEELHSKLIYEVEANHKEGYNGAIDAIFLAFKERYFTPGAVANTVRRSMIATINIIRQLEGNEEDLAWLQELMNWQTKYRNLDQLRSVFTNFIAEAAAYIAKQRGEKSNGSIEKVKKYIDGHFRENIYLKGIAAEFHMNPIYLGQLFRKNYGMYFNEYLLTLRIEEAKRLLRQTKKRMYEIAELVGFQNADYFATQFEKLEKMKPSDYRNKMIDPS
ncbi:two-component system response regulator YesN [Paenibacillus phyllosphaerae]|uniref:Two-component system response regulator YesN n=1 Tax=Paenibacillus phyllosphaerae TaxID=274593 RepID=A0A7W5ASQ0_9BACL|nr:response regulator transcription factor [Paenibacillus phyllosphaerae]MBB3108060.1 two-component system response regulator YesN [Paenibacillus phyllosphaerae]